jgi:molybdate transport system regulatory protein
MPENKKTLFIRSKIWIEDDSGKVVFGLGRYKIFEAIQRIGSIQAAAKELKMSYRAVWGRIKATEERLGKQMLIRNVGGASGGGSSLTPFAKSLVEHFHRLHKNILTQSDDLFEKTFIVPVKKNKS